MENINRTENNGQGFAIAALVVGIIALLFSFIPCFGGAAILIGATAVVFGAVSLSRAGATKAPKGMGIAGLSLGGIAVLISIVWILFIVGTKGKFINNLDQFFNWAEHIEDFEEGFEDGDLESLEDLEKALDELEGAVENVNTEVIKTVDEVKERSIKVIDSTRNKIEEIKSEKLE